MITAFETLLTIGTTHTYYGGPTADFEFVVPEDTARVLAGGRMLARALPDQRLHVAFEADDTGAPRVPSTGRVLRLGLRLLNPYFDNFTDLPPAPPGSIRLYRNAAAGASLGPPVITALLGQIFSHPLSRGSRPATVSVLRDGRPLRSATVTAAAQTSVAFDVTGVDPGSLAVEEVYPGGIRQTTPCYVDGELRRMGAFAVVEITLAAAFYAQAPAFDLDFTSRLQTLKYYVVASHYTAAEFNQLAVLDAGFNEQGRPQITFTKVAAGSFGPGDTPPALLTRGGGTVVLFKSQAPLERRASGRRRIELRRNAEALIPNLPQPAPDNPTSDLVIHVSKQRT